MGPNGEGNGIYLLAGAECWYKEGDQDYAVLTALSLTDHQQMVIAGYAAEEHDTRFEEVSDAE